MNILENAGCDISAAAGAITSYPAMHVWNQPPDEGNHTPAWDVFQIELQ